MSIFRNWIHFQEEDVVGRTLHICTETLDGRIKITDDLRQVMRSHYNDLAQIADDIKYLGYPDASAVLAERLPQTSRARSGDLGEILATEYIEHALGYQIPIRRLRYKDGREMALRGDDFIGIDYNKSTGLKLLKGESKSAAKLSNDTVKKARAALNRDAGRCTPHSLLFVADRLMEGTAAQQILGRVLKTEIARRSLSPGSIDHVVFTMTGNSPLTLLRNDLTSADHTRKQISINLNIDDHQDFIAASYLNLEHLGNN
ncbi:Hachiman antiphage defense system protein HamA [uncultured Chryseobacterium sp.]|uniref:Hachiman antiphage defense system protein HamA n=1 Tax=uncultured Chryseobacterium sp. TaxID=259322 RepID=UPI0025DDA98D|nr:Hachiman antiphage defense system protein HamA [uncultured Chryseobacterium sp.]